MISLYSLLPHSHATHTHTHLVSSLGREWVGRERILATEWISDSRRGGSGGVCWTTTRGNSCGSAKRVILE